MRGSNGVRQGKQSYEEGRDSTFEGGREIGVGVTGKGHEGPLIL